MGYRYTNIHLKPQPLVTLTVRHQAEACATASVVMGTHPRPPDPQVRTECQGGGSESKRKADEDERKGGRKDSCKDQSEAQGPQTPSAREQLPTVELPSPEVVREPMGAGSRVVRSWSPEEPPTQHTDAEGILLQRIDSCRGLTHAE